VCIWNLSTGKSLHKLKAQANIGPGLTFAPDGKHLAASLADHSIQVWKVTKGTPVATLRGHEDEIRGLIYSLNGDQIASWSNDMTVRLWNTRSHKSPHVLIHTDVVTHVAYTPDGKHLISTAADGSSYWDMKTGEHLIQSLNAFGDIVSWFSFSADGSRLATVKADDDQFCLWDMTKVDEGVELYQSRIGSAYGHVWRKRKSDGRMILASIDTSDSLRIEELKENGGRGDSNAGGDGSSSNGHNLQLLWVVGTGTLTMGDAIIDDIVGLSDMNLQLVEQKSTADHLKDWSEGSTERHFEDGGYFEDDANDSEEEVELGDEDEEVEVDEEKTTEADTADAEDGDVKKKKKPTRGQSFQQEGKRPGALNERKR
jgi:WD40 repeat protein